MAFSIPLDRGAHAPLAPALGVFDRGAGLAEPLGDPLDHGGDRLAVEIGPHHIDQVIASQRPPPPLDSQARSTGRWGASCPWPSSRWAPEEGRRNARHMLVRPRVLQATPILSSGGWGDKERGGAGGSGGEPERNPLPAGPHKV